MGKSSSRSSSTPAITVLGINTTARSVLFQQGSDIFTASQRLGWTPAHENPKLPRSHQIQSPDHCEKEGVDLPAKVVSAAANALRKNLSAVHGVNGSLSAELLKKGGFQQPPASLSGRFDADTLMTEASILPEALVTALNCYMGPLTVGNPEARAKAEAAFAMK